MLRQCLAAFRFLERDMTLSRTVTKEEGHQAFATFFGKIVGLKGNTEFDLLKSNIKANPANTITGSSESSERLIEYAAMTAATVVRVRKQAEDLDILNAKSALNKQIKELLLTHAQNPVIAVKAVKTIENNLR